MRVRHGLLVAVVSVLMCLPSATTQTRWTPPGADDYFGYLTWSGGKGGIAWSPSAPSEDPGGPPFSAADDQKRALEHQLFNRVRPDSNPLVDRMGVAEFVGAKLPKTLHLNPLYNIEVDLYVSGYTGTSYDPCYYTSKTAVTGYETLVLSQAGINGPSADPWLEVQLTVDGVLVGGDFTAHPIQWYYSPTDQKSRPPDPAGYGACRYMFHPEVATLPAGSELKLTVTPISSSKGFQYGLAGDHRSAIRFTTYSVEEWAYRGASNAVAGVPLPSEAGKGLDATPDSAPLPAIAGGGLLLLGLALGPHGSRRKAAILLLAAALAMGGCIGGSAQKDAAGDAEKGGSIQNTLVPVSDKNLTSAGNGSLFGMVHDQLNQPLKGVHASLLSTNFFDVSDAKGLFRFPTLPPGVYGLRMDLKEYKSFESNVEVKVGFATKVEITMVPLVEKAGDETWHQHDYWGGAPSKQAMDKDVGQYCNSGSCTPRTDFVLPSPEENDGISSILPGTREVEIIVTWDKDQLPVERVGMMFQHNADKIFMYGNYYHVNYSFLFPRASGESFRIQTTWEMTDPGHQYYSGWHFYLLAASSDPKSQTAAIDPYTKTGQYHVKVILHKGVVPLEPAHPDLWAGGGSVQIIQGATTVYHPGPTGLQNLAYCDVVYPVVYPNIKCGLHTVAFGSPKKAIPGETRWIEVVMNQSADSSPHFDWDLRYRTALSPVNYNYASWTVAPSPVRDGYKSSRWKFAVKEGEVDPIYETKSNWYFVVMPAEKDEQNAKLDYYTGANFQLTFTAFAHKDAMT